MHDGRVLVKLWWWWWGWLDIAGDGGKIVLAVMVRAVVRVAVVIKSNFF